MKTFERICLGAIAAASVFALGELGFFLRDARRDATALTSKIDALIVTANETAGQARDASEQAKLAAGEQREYWKKTSLETYKTMASVRLLIVRTNGSINDVLVPRISATLDGTNRLSLAATDGLTHTLDGLRPVLTNLARASAAAADTMADPAIGQAIAHASQASENTAAASEQMAQVAINLNKASADFASYVHRITAPARGVWNILHTLLGIAAQSRQAGGI